MTIGEQNNKNILALLSQIQGIPVKPYDDSPSLEEQLSEPDDDALSEFKRDREVKEREIDEDLLFEQARERQRGNE